MTIDINNHVMEKVGQFHFCRHRGGWGIFQYTLVSETGSQSSHITSCVDFESALKETYRLNGWGEPKSITKRF